MVAMTERGSLRGARFLADARNRLRNLRGNEIAAHLPGARNDSGGGGARNDGGGVVVAMTDRRRRSQKQRQGG